VLVEPAGWLADGDVPAATALLTGVAGLSAPLEHAARTVIVAHEHAAMTYRTKPPRLVMPVSA
jgi:hypothetical protein